MPGEERVKAKPREYKDGDDFSQYLNHFDRVAAANKWSDATKLVQLETLLKGKAQREFEAFIEEDPDIKWENMTMKLKEEMGPTPQKSLDEFSQLRMEDRSPQEFYAALVRLSKSAHGEMDANPRHVIVRAQMLQAIPKKLRQDASKQQYLASLTKKDLLDLLTKVYDAELREESQREDHEPMIREVQGVNRRNMCDRVEELERDNSKLRMDLAEMKSTVTEIHQLLRKNSGLSSTSGKPPSDNRVPRGREQIVMSEIRCYKCQQKGHFARDCQNERVCSRCKKEGHYYTECPENPKN